MTILIFWDSITQWYNDFLEFGWANMLKNKINKKEKDFQVINLWISGDNVADLLKRFDCMTKAYIEKYNESRSFIFAIWINDSTISIDWTNNLFPLKEFENNLKLLIFKAKTYKPKNITFIWLTNVNENLVCPFPWSDSWKCYKNSRIKKFDEVIEKIALKNDCDYIKMFWVLENSDLDDGIHPNNTWHKKMFEKIWKNLQNNKKLW